MGIPCFLLSANNYLNLRHLFVASANTVHSLPVHSTLLVYFFFLVSSLNQHTRRRFGVNASDSWNSAEMAKRAARRHHLFGRIVFLPNLLGAVCNLSAAKVTERARPCYH